MRNKRWMLLISAVLVVLTTAVSATAGVAQQIPQPVPALPILVVNTGALNVRSGPGPQFSIITKVVGGTELPVLATNPSGTWNLVASPTGTGWVDISFTIPRGDFRFTPVVDVGNLYVPVLVATPVVITGDVDEVIPAPQLEPPGIVVNTGRLNVRSGPGPQFTVLGSVPGGTVLDGLARTPDGAWYLVESPFGRGWVDAEFTLLRGLFDNLAIVSY
jgi:uncharacterized protein YgiM (DUF1202 family)